MRTVLESFATPRAFHECVVAGNEDALEAFYTAGFHLPVLGTEGFLGWAKNKGRRLSWELPHYTLATVRRWVRKVWLQAPAMFDVDVSALARGRRGEANHARKVAISLNKRLRDLPLQETSVHFEVKSYGVVGWGCAQIQAKQSGKQRFKVAGERNGDRNSSTKDLIFI